MPLKKVDVPLLVESYFNTYHKSQTKKAALAAQTVDKVSQWSFILLWKKEVIFGII